MRPFDAPAGAPGCPGRQRRTALRPATVGALLAATIALSGCAEDAFRSAPDCSGTHLLVFTSDRVAGRFEVYLYDLDAGGFRVLTDLNSKVTDNLNPAITLDGQVIAFESARGTTGQDILLYGRCSATFVSQPGLNTAGDETDPAFAGDAIRLAFVRDTLGDRRIRMIDGTSDRLIALPGLDATAGFDDFGPSPDQHGDHIAFVSNRAGNEDVFVYDAIGDSLMSLPDLVSPEQDTDPWLTPSGRYLAFASSRGGGAGDLDLYLYDLQTLAFVPLDASANSPQVDRNPTMSRDARVLAFQSNRTGTGSKGMMDTWIHDRTSMTTSQGLEQSSAANDLQPYLLWP